MPTVTLRPLRESDVDALASWGEDDEFRVAAEWGSSGPDAHRAHWHRLVSEPPADLLRMGAVLEGELVGTVDLHGTEPDRRELGFLVARAFWGRGVGTAAAVAAIDHGFHELGLERVWGEAWETNAASIAILERLMHRTGFGEDGHYRDVPTRYVQYEITRARWRTR